MPGQSVSQPQPNPESTDTGQPISQSSPDEPSPETKQKTTSKKPIILSIFLFIAIAVAGFFGYKYYQSNQQPIIDEQPIPTATPTPTPDPTADWETYTDPTYNFTIKYPQEYSVSGKLASSLQTWKAGQGITFTNQNSSAKPSIFIEAVFDGYGPLFPTGSIDAVFSNGKLHVTLNKVTSQEYQQSIDNGYITQGNELFISKIVKHNGTPFSFHLSHSERGNTDLEQELLQILSTFQFTDKSIQTTSCSAGYSIFENDIFSICHPQEMVPQNNYYTPHDRENIQATRVILESPDQKLNIITAFTGGWGGGSTSETTTVNNYPTNLLIFKDEIGNIINLVAMIDSGERQGQFPIALDLQRKTEQYLDRNEFNTILNSFKLK